MFSMTFWLIVVLANPSLGTQEYMSRFNSAQMCAQMRQMILSAGHSEKNVSKCHPITVEVGVAD